MYSNKKKKGMRLTVFVGGKWSGRIKEGIATFRAKKVLCVICPLPQRGIVETDELFVNDSGLARVATWSEAL